MLKLNYSNPDRILMNRFCSAFNHFVTAQFNRVIFMSPKLNILTSFIKFRIIFKYYQKPFSSTLRLSLNCL